MADDWDLYAVVRSCKSASNSSTKTATVTTLPCEQDSLSCLAKLKFEQENDDFPFSFPNFEEPKDNAFQELQQFYKPFLPNPTITTTTCSTSLIPNSFSVSEIGGSSGQHNTLYSQNQQQTPIGHQFTSPNKCYISGLGHSQEVPKRQTQLQNQRINQRVQRPQPAINSQPSRSRKRKSQQKKIMCEVPQENLSSDMWAWRKYGQKPIKGSPYPRNYYRCSSSKGCAARKQVERNSKNPSMFTVTYTGDHTHPRPTHRNSLAGSTRSKFTATSNNSTPNKEEKSTASGLSPTTPLTVRTTHEEETTKQSEENLIEKESEEDFDVNEDEEEEDEEEEDILIPNMVMSEDIFMGFRELGCGSPVGGSGGGDKRSPDDTSDNFADKGQFNLGSSSGGATVGGSC